jgi:hypothetical protein
MWGYCEIFKTLSFAYFIPKKRMTFLQRKLQFYPRTTASAVHGDPRGAGLDSGTIPEYFAPPGVFCFFLCEENDPMDEHGAPKVIPWERSLE